jgi:hypothetical protein
MNCREKRKRDNLSDYNAREKTQTLSTSKRNEKHIRTVKFFF